MKFKPLVAVVSGIVVAFSFTPPAAADTDWGEILDLTVKVIDAAVETDTEKKEKLHAVQNQESLITGKWQNLKDKEDDTYLLIGSDGQCNHVYIKGSSSDYHRGSFDCNYDKIAVKGYLNYESKDGNVLYSVEWINEDEFRTEVISSPNSKNEGNKTNWHRLDREITASYRERRTTTTTRRSTKYSNSSSSYSPSTTYTPPASTYTGPGSVDYTNYNRTQNFNNYLNRGMIKTNF